MALPREIAVARISKAKVLTEVKVALVEEVGNEKNRLKISLLLGRAEVLDEDTEEIEVASPKEVAQEVWNEKDPPHRWVVSLLERAAVLEIAEVIEVTSP